MAGSGSGGAGMRRLLSGALALGVGTAVLGGALTRGDRVFAFQRSNGGGSGTSSNQGLGSASTASVPSAGGRAGALSIGSDNPFDGSRREGMDETRLKMASTERQRMMSREADQILQNAAELQASMSGGADLSREDLFKRADAIEKMARNVKERMKGTR